MVFLVTGSRHPCTPFSTPAATPWHCIGGCGLGGSGGAGGSASGIRWSGNEVKGYLVSYELLSTYSLGNIGTGPYKTSIVASRLKFHPTWNTECAILLPLGVKKANIRYQENLSSSDISNGGIGDLSVDFNQTFGSTGHSSISASLTFPTGDYDAGSDDQRSKIYPTPQQMGRGIFSFSIGGSHRFDIENGMITLDGRLHYPFALRFDKRNEFLDSDYRAYRDMTGNRRFYYAHYIKPYGENDRGDYFPPSIELFAAYSWYRHARVVHSLQSTFTVPFGTQWIHHYDPTRYAPYPDPDHHAWNMFFAYGIELSFERFPLFFGAGFPVRDQKGIDNRWDGIDRESLFREWTCVAGITAGIF